MRIANVTLTINLNMEVPEIMTEDKIEGAAYWLIKPFLDNFDGKIDGCKVLKNSMNVEKRYTNVNCYVANYIAEQIVLEDNEEEDGGIAFLGETLDDFIQEERSAFKEYGTVDMDDEFIYDIPLGVVNGALNECGIKMITTEEWVNANDKAIKEFLK
jgi:hypothetical protein